MSPRRRWIIALQAAAVAVLVPVVYATLLRPDEPKTLKGIEAPRAGGAAAARHGESRLGENHASQARQPEKHGTGAGGGAGDSGQPDDGDGAPGGVLAGASGLGAPETAKAWRTPSDAQYDDAVKALLDRVHTGG